MLYKDKQKGLFAVFMCLSYSGMYNLLKSGQLDALDSLITSYYRTERLYKESEFMEWKNKYNF